MFAVECAVDETWRTRLDATATYPHLLLGDGTTMTASHKQREDKLPKPFPQLPRMPRKHGCPYEAASSSAHLPSSCSGQLGSPSPPPDSTRPGILCPTYGITCWPEECSTGCSRGRGVVDAGLVGSGRRPRSGLQASHTVDSSTSNPPFPRTRADGAEVVEPLQS